MNGNTDREPVLVSEPYLRVPQCLVEITYLSKCCCHSSIKDVSITNKISGCCWAVDQFPQMSSCRSERGMNMYLTSLQAWGCRPIILVTQ